MKGLRAIMDMLSLHGDALKSGSTSYHEFLARYSKTQKVVYGFVEGKDDPCYFRGFIEQLIPGDWDVELWPAGNKKQVYDAYSSMDWGRFPKQRVCFFADRDFLGLVPESIVADLNIYVTDDYSIENSLTKRGTCRRILTEVFGFVKVKHGELEDVCDRFEAELERFMVSLIPITAWMLSWRRSGRIAYINNIKMSDLFSVVEGRLRLNTGPGGCATITEYLHSRCKVHYGGVSIQSIEIELKQSSAYRKFTRGKFLLWFLVEFCRSVREGATAIFVSCDRIPHINVTVSASNAMVIIGSRGRIPESLRVFLRETYCSYIEQNDSREEHGTGRRKNDEPQ